jgi:hypothetical protein
MGNSPIVDAEERVIFGIVAVAQLPDAWLSHLFGTPD